MAIPTEITRLPPLLVMILAKPIMEFYHKIQGVWLVLLFLMAGCVVEVLAYLPDELNCPPRDSLQQFRLLKIKFPPGTAMRAMSTVPPGFEVNWSGIAGAGMGAFTTSFIKKHTFLGEYEGIFRTPTDPNASRYSDDYSWKLGTSTGSSSGKKWFDFGMNHSEITKDKKRMLSVDALDENYASWLRYINAARFHSEQNVVAMACQGRLYYKTWSDLPPNTELLVFYGIMYLSKFGITINDYLNNEDAIEWKDLSKMRCR